MTTQTSTVLTLDLRDCDSSNSHHKFITDLHASLQSTGFVCIKGHGISDALLQQSYQLNRDLFDLDLNTKQKYALKDLGRRGYTSFGKEIAKDHTAPDLKEFWHIGPELDTHSNYINRYPTNLWPTELPEFRTVMSELYSALQSIAHTLLAALGEALKMDSSYFPALVKDGNSVLRLIHYPPVKGMDTQNQMRAAPHADINLMTLLVGASASGLQLLSREDEWLDVVNAPGEIVVDTGDMMQMLTGGKLPSTVHRVINPDNSENPRYSMPFFLHPHSDADISCLPQFRQENIDYSTSTADEFLQQRMRENGLIK